MMRFGNHQSPVLLEALGDLLLAEQDGPKLLAARAYMKASLESDDPSTKKTYLQLAQQALSMQTEGRDFGETISRSHLENTFEQELKEAHKWWNELHREELAWIEAGDNVDEKFAQKYLQQNVLLAEYIEVKPYDDSDVIASYKEERQQKMIIIALLIGFACVCLAWAGFLRYWKKRTSKMSAVR